MTRFPLFHIPAVRDFSVFQIQNLTTGNQSVSTKALQCRNASETLLAETKARSVNITGEFFTLDYIYGMAIIYVH